MHACPLVHNKKGRSERIHHVQGSHLLDLLLSMALCVASSWGVKWAFVAWTKMGQSWPRMAITREVLTWTDWQLQGNCMSGLELLREKERLWLFLKCFPNKSLFHQQVFLYSPLHSTFSLLLPGTLLGIKEVLFEVFVSRLQLNQYRKAFTVLASTIWRWAEGGKKGMTGKEIRKVIWNQWGKLGNYSHA